jgi:hypothetical protein
MSMIAASIAPGEFIAVAGDGIAYDNDGNTLLLASKLILMPEISACLGWTGVGGWGPRALHVLQMLNPRNTFDGAVAAFATAAEATWLDLMREYFHVIGYGACSMILAGWSESTGRPTLCRVSSYPKGVTNAATAEIETRPAWAVDTTHEGFWASTTLPEETMTAFGLTADANPMELAVRAICAGRSQSGRLSDGEPWAVGGFVQVALIRPGFCWSHIAHRWPDELGKPVDPSVGDPLPPFPLSIPA